MQRVEKFIRYLEGQEEYENRIVHLEHIDSRPAVYENLFFPPRIRKILKKQGIEKLYSHQVRALQVLRRGANSAVVTPAASGKTLIYNLSLLETLLKDPSARALYIFPLKALAQDQLQTIRDFKEGGWEVKGEIYDGDTSTYKRSRIRKDPPSVILTNPDMLHLGILPYHGSWENFFRNLKLVVVDEVHTYRGIFGSHVANVIRRLRRISRYYGANPQFVLSSATIGEAREFVETLSGLSCEVIKENGAPASPKCFLFWNPVSSIYREAQSLFRECVEHDFKTILFTKARKITELIHQWIIEENPDLERQISSYRAGYLPEERREIEKRFFSEELKGVISTSALELGIDIGGLDVCILVGYPGTIMATWQRAGRVGRQEREALLVMMALSDALDQYFISHPREFFQRGYETPVIDPFNLRIFSEHLLCAAAELPLTKGDEKVFGREMFKVLEILLARGKVTRKGKRWLSCIRRPQRGISIRSIGGGYTIIDSENGRVIGEVGLDRVFPECHPGAVYLHKGNQYEVIKLDLERKNVYAREMDSDYYTECTSVEEVEILEELEQKELAEFKVKLGRVKVTSEVVSFEKKRITNQILLSEHPLSLPPQIFQTQSLWMEIPPSLVNSIHREGLDLAGGIHALEHAAIALFPLFAMCDRRDVGGVSYPFHYQTGEATVFIYDSYPEGVGLAERAYKVIEQLLKATLKLIRDCSCEEGCPSCIQCPKCGNRNKPLDKEAALRLLTTLEARKISGATFSNSCKNELVKSALPSGRGKRKKLPEHILFFDLETQKSAEEVGGWENARLMGISVAVIYDNQEKKYKFYTEEEINELFRELLSADLVVGFNIKRFDWEVLSEYSGRINLRKIPTLDLLEEIHSILGFRLSLGHLAETTLRKGKSADGLQAIKWYRERKMEELFEYCRNDVRILKKLYEYGKKRGYLFFERRGEKLKLPVNW